MVYYGVTRAPLDQSACGLASRYRARRYGLGGQSFARARPVVTDIWGCGPPRALFRGRGVKHEKEAPFRGLAAHTKSTLSFVLPKGPVIRTVVHENES